MSLKARLPKEWDDLKPSVQKKINEIYTEAANQLINQQVDKEEAELQKTWILYGAVALAENGASRDDILVWIGSWKRIYHANGRMKTKEEQEAFVKEHLSILGGDYPFEFVDSLERC
jgi:hypothetical protein